jgi:hypothetical protein
MQKIKSFNIQSQPTARGINKDLAALVDDTVNKWIDANPLIKNVRVSHSSDESASFPTAFVIIIYDAPESVEPAKKIAETSEVVSEVDAQRRRGRPSKSE